MSSPLINYYVEPFLSLLCLPGHYYIFLKYLNRRVINSEYIETHCDKPMMHGLAFFVPLAVGITGLVTEVFNPTPIGRCVSGAYPMGCDRMPNGVCLRGEAGAEWFSVFPATILLGSLFVDYLSLFLIYLSALQRHRESKKSVKKRGHYVPTSSGRNNTIGSEKHLSERNNAISSEKEQPGADISKTHKVSSSNSLTISREDEGDATSNVPTETNEERTPSPKKQISTNQREDSNASLIQANTAAISSSSPVTARNLKKVTKLSFIYGSLFTLTYSFVGALHVVTLVRNGSRPPPFWLVAVASCCFPLQGSMTGFYYLMGPKHDAVRKAFPDKSWFWTWWYALTKGADNLPAPPRRRRLSPPSGSDDTGTSSQRKLSIRSLSGKFNLLQWRTKSQAASNNELEPHSITNPTQVTNTSVDDVTGLSSTRNVLLEDSMADFTLPQEINARSLEDVVALHNSTLTSKNDFDKDGRRFAGNCDSKTNDE